MKKTRVVTMNRKTETQKKKQIATLAATRKQDNTEDE